MLTFKFLSHCAFDQGCEANAERVCAVQLDISCFHKRSISGQIEVPRIRETRVNRSGLVAPHYGAIAQSINYVIYNVYESWLS